MTKPDNGVPATPAVGQDDARDDLHAFSCAARAADPTNEFATCRSYCGDSTKCFTTKKPKTFEMVDYECRTRNDDGTYSEWTKLHVGTDVEARNWVDGNEFYEWRKTVRTVLIRKRAAMSTAPASEPVTGEGGSTAWLDASAHEEGRHTIVGTLPRQHAIVAPATPQEAACKASGSTKH